MAGGQSLIKKKNHSSHEERIGKGLWLTGHSSVTLDCWRFISNIPFMCNSLMKARTGLIGLVAEVD